MHPGRCGRTAEDGGRWGVARDCNCRTVLEVIATLIEAQRPDLAMVFIERERGILKNNIRCCRGIEPRLNFPLLRG